MRQFYRQRAGEVAAIEREIATTTVPLILLCDCTMINTSVAADQLRGALGDSFREAGWGLCLTSPAGWLPLQRIDYV